MRVEEALAEGRRRREALNELPWVEGVAPRHAGVAAGLTLLGSWLADLRCMVEQQDDRVRAAVWVGIQRQRALCNRSGCRVDSLGAPCQRRDKAPEASFEHGRADLV